MKTTTNINVAFASVKRMLHKIAMRHFIGCDGRYELDELTSIAFLGFTESHQTYDPKRAKYTTWIYHGANNRILQMRRDEERRAKRFRALSAEIEPRSKSSLPSYDPSVSKDAKEVIELTISMPSDVESAAVDSGGHSRDYRRAIRQKLLDRGWANYRINQAFREIKLSLR